MYYLVSEFPSLGVFLFVQKICSQILKVPLYHFLLTAEIISGRHITVLLSPLL